VKKDKGNQAIATSKPGSKERLASTHCQTIKEAHDAAALVEARRILNDEYPYVTSCERMLAKALISALSEPAVASERSQG
jgi:hypothetical protein